MERSMKNFCVLICAYQEAATIGPLVCEVLKSAPRVLVVDDGSADATGVLAEAAGAEVLRLETNQGKGMALKTGFQWIREQGFQGVITLDGDGQHDPAEIPKFIATYERTGIPVLIGNRMTAPGRMPLIRRWTNRFMSHCLDRMTGLYIADPPCGYRFYRSDVLPHIASEAKRFSAEFEMLLKIAQHRIKAGSVRVRSIYEGQRSRISVFSDMMNFLAVVRHYCRRAQKNEFISILTGRT